MMRKLLCMIATALTVFSVTPTTAYADENNKVGVHDLANVLTDEQEETLQAIGKNYANTYDLDIVYLTADDTNGKSSMVYSDDFYDGLEGDTEYGPSGILVFVDLANGDPGEGYDYVNTVGTAILNIDDAEVEHILDEAFEVPADDYYNRLRVMMDTAIRMYNEDYYSSDYNYDAGKSIITFESIFVGLIASIFTYSILHKKHNSANVAVRAKEYVLENQSKITPGEPVYIRTYTTVNKDYYKKSSSSSGSRSRGGSSHRSSSGRSHGGGGRRR